MSTGQDIEKERSIVPLGSQGRNLRSLLEDMDRMMGFPWGWPFRARPFTRSLMSACDWMPDVDVLEQDNKILVRADLPGMKREDIDVSVRDGMLVLRGQREEEKEVKSETYYGSERATGKFYRTFGLPEGVSPDEVEASYTDGVLEVSVPKRDAQEPQSVQIEVK